ncbi:hypothetical protein GGF31_004375 [Allomyces arbusculus]|nr:hypothetical protein GGF31_004375 [Allomyces arbusculus]
MVEVIHEPFYVTEAAQQLFTLDRVAFVIKSAGVMDMTSFSVHFGRTRVTYSANGAPNHPNAKFFDAPVGVVMVRRRACTVALFMREVGPRAQWTGEPVPMRVQGPVRAADVAGQAFE